MPRLEGDIKITNVSTGVRPGTDAVAERIITTEFRVRDKGPFTVVSPIDGYNAAATRQQIDAFADEIIATLEIT